MVGCGVQSSKDRYVADYQPLNDRVVALNDRLVRTLGTPSSPDRLAGELAPLPGEMDRLGRQIAALDTPEDLREESAALSRSLARTGAGVGRTATLARNSDRRALVASVRRLADDVDRLARRSNRLADAAG